MSTVTILPFAIIRDSKTTRIVPLHHHEKDTHALPRRTWHSYVLNVEMNWERIKMWSRNKFGWQNAVIPIVEIVLLLKDRIRARESKWGDAL
jgi:hypothetical protein